MGLFTRKKGSAEPSKDSKAVKEDKKTVPAEKPVVKQTAPPEPARETAAKPAEKPAVKPADKQEDGSKADAKNNGAYFVSPHPDGGWQVKKAKAQKALKKFKTKAEAEAYAKQVAENQGSTVVRQKKDGKIQKKR